MSASAVELTPDHIDLARSVALRLHRQRPSVRRFDREDVIQEGYLGMLQARDRWRPDGPKAFEDFLALQVRSAVLEMVRYGSPLSRGHYRAVRRGKARQYDFFTLDEDKRSYTPRDRLEIEDEIRFLFPGPLMRRVWLEHLGMRRSMQDIGRDLGFSFSFLHRLKSRMEPALWERVRSRRHQ